MKIYRKTAAGTWQEEVPKIDDTLPYRERILKKDEHEDFTWNRILQQVPWSIERSKRSKDMQGIDAILTGLKGGQSQTKPKTIQLKIRQSGNDVLLEVIKPYPPADINNPWTGKDIINYVDLYYCVDTTGVLRIFNAEKLKDAAKTLAAYLLDQNLNNPRIRSFRGVNGEARIVVDPSSESNFKLGKVEKMNVFIDPLKITPMYAIQL